MKNKILSLASALAFFCGSAALANPEFNAQKTGTQGQDNRQVVHSAKYQRGALVNITNGYREISGWEKQVVKRDKNLRHWKWIPMMEAKRAYIRLAPGKETYIAGKKRKSHYPKPVHIVATKGLPRRHQPVVIATAGPRHSVYMKPVHVATQVSPKLRLPDNDMALHPGLRLPNGAGDCQPKLLSKGTDIKLATQNTGAKLGTRDANGQLVAKNTSAQLATPTEPVVATYGTLQSTPRSYDLDGSLSNKQVRGRIMTKKQLNARPVTYTYTY